MIWKSLRPVLSRIDVSYSYLGYSLNGSAALRIDPLDALEASKIAIALQHSFRNGKPVYFDDEGMPILESTKANGDIKN